MTKKKKGELLMNYELLLDAVKEVSKEKLKEISFKLDDQTIQAIKEMDLSEDEKRQLILMSKDRAFFDMLLINALKEE
ncbi:hypothetical protein G5B03_09500 [Blautia massiliensis]|nr:hypothetical protein [Blautia massiliensis (ex Durand et al. 2017)]